LCPKACMAMCVAKDIIMLDYDAPEPLNCSESRLGISDLNPEK
jgi:hypothetical protein